MKKSLIVLLLFCTSSFMFAQSVAIECHGGGSGCFSPDPQYEVAYYVRITNEPTGYSRSITWNPSSGYHRDNGKYSEVYQVEWNNVDTVQSVKVTVTWTKPGQPNIVRTDERTVTIKYIAPITAMSITGDLTASPYNGATIEIPCGVKSLNVSVAPPATNPSSSVVYTWTKPSGWSGTSNTNTISFTTDSGQNDGYFGLAYKRSDGNYEQYYTVYFTRPRVTGAVISAGDSWSPFDKALCSGETRILSGTNSLNATNFSWSAGGGISIVSGQYSSNVTISGSSNGQITLTANNACQAPQYSNIDIYSGGPQVSSSQVTVDGHPNYYPNYNDGTSYINISNSPSCQAYNWTIFGGSGNLYPNQPCSTCGGPSYVHCNSGSITTPSSLSVKIRSANRCGTGTDVILVFQKSSGMYRMTSGNPVKDGAITLEITDEETMKLLRTTSLIRNNSSEFVRYHDFASKKGNANVIGKSISFSVKGLPKGLYHLLLNFEGDHTLSENIVIE